MPWCPKCKAEYQEGVTVCSDCNVELVDSLEEPEEELELFYQSEDKELTERLVKFLEYSDVKSELQFNEQTGLYAVSILPNQRSEAEKLYEAFYYVESNRSNLDTVNETAEEEAKDTEEDDEAEKSEESEAYDDEETGEKEGNSSSVSDEAKDYHVIDDTDESAEDDEYEDKVPSDDVSGYENKNDDSVYVMKEDQYKDLSGSVWIFMIFGIAGLLFVLLNVCGILSIFTWWLPNTVMAVLFLLFIYIALSTNKKAKKIQLEIDDELRLTEKINHWLEENVTQSFLSSVHDDSLSDELNYIKITDEIKDMLIKEFGPQNLAYLDRLIDDYYNSNFEQDEELQ